MSGLASMYPASDWSICSGPSWISARVRSHYRTDLDWAIWVTSVRMRREDRTSISSRRPRQVKRINLATSLLAPHFSASVAVCVELESSGLVHCLTHLPGLECPATGQDAPGDAGQFIGKGDRQHVVMKPLPDMIMSVNGTGRLNCPPGPLGMRACRMSFHIGSPFSVRYVSGFFLHRRYHAVGTEFPKAVTLSSPILSIVRPCFGQTCIECLGLVDRVQIRPPPWGDIGLEKELQ